MDKDANDSGIKKKADELLKKDSAKERSVGRYWRYIVLILSAVMVTYYVASAGYIWANISDGLTYIIKLSPGLKSWLGPISSFFDRLLQPQFHRGTYVLITFMLIFILFPFMRMGEKPKYSSNYYAIFTLAPFGLLFLWILNNFAISDIEAKADLGYMTYYLVGAFFIFYLFTFVVNIFHQREKDLSLPLYVNIAFLLLTVLLGGYWIYQFSELITLGDKVNAKYLNEAINFLGFNIGLGTLQKALGWLTTVGGLVFLIYIFVKPYLPFWTKKLEIPGVSDLIFFTASIVTVLYYISNFTDLNLRSGGENDIDFLIGAIGILVSLEVARRVLGRPLAIIGYTFLVYAYFGLFLAEFGIGTFIPLESFAHAGSSVKQISVKLFIHTIGVFGTMANVLATYVILFIFFGAFLKLSGATQFFVDFAMASAGRAIGGPAKVSVLASALFGSISGSAIANTVSTGVFTIPLMKKAGFRPHVAGAIEPSASIAGMFLPPVMGAGGFLMAELTEEPYSYIMAVAILPALMYIWGVFTMIHFEAKKYDLKGLPKEEVPSIKKLMKEQWFMMLPLLVITWMMVEQFSAGNAAFWGIMTCIIISLANRSIKQGNKWSSIVLFLIPVKMVLDLVIYLIALTGPLNVYVKAIYDAHPGYYIIVPVFFLVVLTFFIDKSRVLINKTNMKKIWDMLKSIGHEIWNATTLGAKQTLVIGATVGAIGVIIGSVELTGLASRFSNILLDFAGKNIFANIIMVALASLVLGMGVPVTAAYMITIVLVAPVFDELGVSLIAAHMIVYWFSQDSNITPPVCIAAYAGAAIAGADPWKTGWTSFKFAKMLYVMPILFAYVPAILLDGSVYEILVAFISCIIGTVAFSSLTMLYFIEKTKWYEWAIMLPTTVLLFWPTLITTAIGVGLLVLVYFMQKVRVRKAIA